MRLKEAFGLMEKHEGRARYVAGGTDAVIRIKQKVWQPDALISLRWIEELRGMEKVDKSLVIGSMTLWREIETDPLVLDSCPALAKAASMVANPQIRNRGHPGRKPVQCRSIGGWGAAVDGHGSGVDHFGSRR